MEPLTRTCNVCKRTFTLENFYPNTTGLYGKDSNCKDCRNKKLKIYRDTHQERIKKYLELNKEKISKKREVYNQLRRQQVFDSEKVCPRCGVSKKVQEFMRNNKTNIHTFCNSCLKVSKEKTKAKIALTEKIKRQENKAVYAERQRIKYSKNRIAYMLHSSRARAKSKNMVFNLEEKDIIFPERCPVFGTIFEIGVKKPSNFSPSLDRINSKIGYVKGNIIIVSFRVNNLKCNATFEELEKILKYLEEVTPKIENKGDSCV